MFRWGLVKSMQMLLMQCTHFLFWLWHLGTKNHVKYSASLYSTWVFGSQEGLLSFTTYWPLGPQSLFYVIAEDHLSKQLLWLFKGISVDCQAQDWAQCKHLVRGGSFHCPLPQTKNKLVPLLYLSFMWASSLPTPFTFVPMPASNLAQNHHSYPTKYILLNDS